MIRCIKEKERKNLHMSVCVCVCARAHFCMWCVQDTEMLMPLLWALSSTLSISVYNVERKESPCNSRRPDGRWGHEKSMRVLCSVLEKGAEDKLTSCWSHSLCCQTFGLIHAVTEALLSELLDFWLPSGKIWVIMLAE